MGGCGGPGQAAWRAPGGARKGLRLDTLIGPKRLLHFHVGSFDQA